MGKFKIPYLVSKPSGRNVLFYWQPRRWFYVDGEKIPCPFTPRRVAKASNQLADAIKEAKEWNALLQEWRIGKVVQQPLYQRGTFGWLVTQYTQDARFIDLRPTTKAWYQHMIPMLLDVFTDVPLEKITRQLAREFYLVHAHQRRKSQALAGLARTIMHFGRDTQRICLAENFVRYASVLVLIQSSNFVIFVGQPWCGWRRPDAPMQRLQRSQATVYRTP
jgi:hypothetical protein